MRMKVADWNDVIEVLQVEVDEGKKLKDEDREQLTGTVERIETQLDAENANDDATIEVVVNGTQEQLIYRALASLNSPETPEGTKPFNSSDTDEAIDTEPNASHDVPGTPRGTSGAKVGKRPVAATGDDDEAPAVTDK